MQDIFDRMQKIISDQFSVDPDEITQNIHTQAKWWKQYLEPLAATDLLSDCFLSVDSIDSVQLVDQGGTAATATDADELCMLVFEIGYGLVPTANEEEAGLKKQILSALKVVYLITLRHVVSINLL